MATTFGVSGGDYIRPYKNSRVQHFPEAATQTFKRGAVLIIGGAGVENQVKIAGDTPSAAIVGIAAADASGVTGTMVPVWLAHNDAEFIGRTVSTRAVDFSDIGVLVALLIDATNVIWVVDASNTGADAAVTLQYVSPDSKSVQTVEGDSSVWAVFRFVQSATIWGKVA